MGSANGRRRMAPAGRAQAARFAGQTAGGRWYRYTRVAKKSRTPPPPRPVQAPKVRTEKQQRRERSPRLILASSPAPIVLALVVGGIVFAATRGGGGAEAGGVCEVTTYPAQGQQHVPPYEIT